MQRGTTRAAVVMLGVALLMGVAPVAVAADGDCARCGGGAEGDQTVDADASDGTITAEVRVEGTSPGGSSVSVSTPTVRVRPVCRYERGSTGAGYWDYFESGDAEFLEKHHPSWPKKLFERPEGLEEHKDDDGYWWHPTCKGDVVVGPVSAPRHDDGARRVEHDRVAHRAQQQAREALPTA